MITLWYVTINDGCVYCLVYVCKGRDTYRNLMAASRIVPYTGHASLCPLTVIGYMTVWYDIILRSVTSDAQCTRKNTLCIIISRSHLVPWSLVYRGRGLQVRKLELAFIWYQTCLYRVRLIWVFLEVYYGTKFAIVTLPVQLIGFSNVGGAAYTRVRLVRETWRYK